MVVPLALRGDLGACCGGRVDLGAAATQPDRMDPLSGRAVARGCARRDPVRVGGAGRASGSPSRRLLGCTRLVAVAGLLRLATGGCVRVPRRPTSFAAVAPVRDLRGRLDGPPGAVAGAGGAARGAVLGRAEPDSSSVAGSVSAFCGWRPGWRCSRASSSAQRRSGVATGAPRGSSGCRCSGWPTPRF